jgi:uncharacterized protein DUF3105
VGRQRMRPVRRQPPPASGATAPAPAARPAALRPPKPQWRQTFDSYGGIWTLAIVVAALLTVGTIVYASARASSQRAVSTDPLMGEENPLTAADHVANESQLIIPEGQPPTAGPHFASPQPLGIYEEPVADGNALHSLEHGIVWISYNPDKLDKTEVKKLWDLAKQYSNDVIVSPRKANTMAVAAASWRRLLKQDSLNIDELKRFIVTNRNRSPEPGVRDNVPMRVPSSG